LLLAGKGENPYLGSQYMNRILIRGARQHNLKNINLDLPRDQLIVISGKSGSGKSSLAFDTIFAEGQRRYVESLSAYARQFLGQMDKPDLDYIEGLSPAISIEQKTTHRNPRSTVGTVTEIYDYYRLLFARIGQPYCYKCGKKIEEQSIDQIIDSILSKPTGSKLVLLAPIIRGKKGEHVKVMEDASKAGFARIRVDGQIYESDEKIKLDKQKKHSIEIVVDRIKIQEDVQKRVAESVETALSLGNGLIQVLDVSHPKHPQEELSSQKNACVHCGISIPELQPRLFSFNNPYGACEECSGLGMTLEFDPDLVIPDPSLSFNQGAVATSNPEAAWHRSRFEALADHFGFSLDTPLNKLPKKIWKTILHGSDEQIEITYVNREKTGKFEYQSKFPGVLNELKRRYLETTSQGVKQWLEGYMTQRSCPSCEGRRLKPEALSVLVGEKNIHALSSMSVKDSRQFFSKLKLAEKDEHIAHQILKEITSRLQFLEAVGLDYLSLERKAGTLSGGEAQRIRLATQIGSSLVGVLYILDEPTIGLHQRDNDRLINTLKHLRDLGNTLIVVEHDEQTLRTADYIVDLGPGAGVHGGKVIAEGKLPEILKNSNSITGQYLSGNIEIPIPKQRRTGNGKSIILQGCKEHNLKNIDVEFPLGQMMVVSGVSGSGKSTLVGDILYPSLMNHVGSRSHRVEGQYSKLTGVEHIDKIINIDQSPYRENSSFQSCYLCWLIYTGEGALCLSSRE
jgi:excinuclease ABC subunit A